MYAKKGEASIFYSLLRPKVGKNGKSSHHSFSWKLAGNACFCLVGTPGLEPGTSAM